MKKAFGHDFIVVNDVHQLLDPAKIGGGPWVHLASIRRGLKEYIAFKHLHGKEVYIEEVDPKDPSLFKKIKEDSEWADLYRFLLDGGYLVVAGLGKEMKGGINGIPGLKLKPKT